MLDVAKNAAGKCYENCIAWMPGKLTLELRSKVVRMLCRSHIFSRRRKLDNDRGTGEKKSI